ncbi:MAG: tRNA pseudouridine(55) synthase TruB [Clostridia bacterium]|nr:tRNA pseudouridine(55) synthase TruB [Clostridia bacterium]
MDGFINLLKPPGMTSSDGVLFVRRLLPRKTPVGHGGTLDPDAAGVLPVCVGRATRLFDYIIDKKKTYIGEICFGVSTDTCDATGKPVAFSERIPDREEVEAALSGFIGDIMQVPPMFSALKRDGKKLYELARKGESIELEARRVHIHNLTYVSQTSFNKHLIRIECGKGVYIRSLMRDIGQALNLEAHMSFLLRSEAGAFSVENGYTPDELKVLPSIEEALQPMDSLLQTYPRIDVKGEFRKKILCGMPVKPQWLAGEIEKTDAPIRVYTEGEFAGMGEMRESGEIAFRAMLLGG